MRENKYKVVLYLDYTSLHLPSATRSEPQMYHDGAMMHQVESILDPLSTPKYKWPCHLQSCERDVCANPRK